MRSLPFLFHEALTNLRRHGLMTVAAVTTLAVSLALMGSFLITFYQVNAASHRAVTDFEMRVFCRQGIKKNVLPGLEKRLAALDGVQSVRYVSKEAAFATETKNSALNVDGVPNLFPETFVIKLSDARQAVPVAQTVRGWRNFVEEVALPESEIGAVLKLIAFLRTLGAISGTILLFGALLVVSNTIRVSVFARRREIKIMQIVGATSWFIRLPLFLEGVMHGLLGGIFASLALVLVGNYVSGLIRSTVPLLTAYSAPVDLVGFCLLLTLGGVVIGASGSLLSIRRYLKTV